jgi:hypothetical protein
LERFMSMPHTMRPASCGRWAAAEDSARLGAELTEYRWPP